MKKLILSLIAICSFVALSAQAATCLKHGYTNNDVIALEQIYVEQVAQIMADREYAITHTTGETADEKNAQVLAIVEKSDADLKMAYNVYMASYAAMTYTCK